jgi:tryptophanyl-tRNA synthetase
MAADILAYKATHVPVGDDQKQHLELTRDIAQKFNADFKVELFPLPEPMILGEATRVMSLRDGRNKMSKSDPSEYSRINLTDGPDDIALKIRRAKTDPDPLPREPAGLEGRPEADNLVGIYAALSRKSRDEALATVGGMQFSAFKQELTDLAVTVLGPIGEEMQRLVKDPGYIDSVLRKGGERARAISRPVLQEVYERVGFLQP